MIDEWIFKTSNFFDFQSYELRFSEKICLFLIRSFPGSFVSKSHPVGGYLPPLLYYSRFGENIDETSRFESSEINPLVQKRPNPPGAKIQDHTSP